MNTRSLVAVVAVLLAACAPAAPSAGHLPSDPPGLSCQDFGPDGVGGLTFSPTGSRIAISVAVPGAAGHESRLWIADGHDLGSKELAADADIVGLPSLRADGRLAWIQIGPSGHTVLFELEAPGRSAIQRLEMPFLADVFEIPSGILYGQDVGETATEYRVLRDDGSTEDLFTADPRPVQALVAKEGSLIVTLAGTPDRKGAILTVHHDGKVSTVTLDSPIVLYGFTPSTDRVVFGGLGGARGLWTVGLDDGRKQQINFDAEVGALDIASDGRLAYAGPLLSPTEGKVCITDKPISFPM